MNLGGFISAAVLLTLMPGPDILFVITQGVTRGRKAAVVFAAGLCTGLLFHIAAVTLGVSALVAGSDIAFTVFKFAGAAYLIGLGVKAFFNRNRVELRFTEEGKHTLQLYKRGILMNILNPKVILFFFGFFPSVYRYSARRSDYTDVGVGGRIYCAGTCRIFCRRRAGRSVIRRIYEKSGGRLLDELG